MGEYTILPGRVEEILPSMFSEGDFDACLCDPPYLLEFMGKEFDRQHKKMEGANDGQRMQRWHERWGREVLRVMKPGAHMLAFGGTRTYHRLASAMEDVGFEVRDTMSWLHGQGFPKNKDTQLKPAVEPCVLARKAGVGRLNIDGCRIGTDGGCQYVGPSVIGNASKVLGSKSIDSIRSPVVPGLGRWPANLILSHHEDCHETDRTVTHPRNGSINPQTAAASTPRTGSNSYSPDNRPRGEWQAYEDVVKVWECHPDCPVRMLDEQSGITKSGVQTKPNPRSGGGLFKTKKGEAPEGPQYGDKGGASRFFYCSKVSPRERHLGGIDCRHPTLKPISLCTYLATLLLPPPPSSPRCILVPFSGAGSEVIGALKAGWDKVYGIEQDEEYNMWAEARIHAALEGGEKR